MQTQYTIKKQPSGKYIVFFGSLPFSRPMAKHDAEQWLALQNGLIGEMTISWNGSQTRNIIKASKGEQQ